MKFLDEVKRATGDDTEQMAQLFGFVEGLNILILTGKGVGGDKIMDQMPQSASRAFETFNSIATVISKTGSVSKCLSIHFRGLIPVCRSIAIVSKDMGNTFLTAQMMIIMVL